MATASTPMAIQSTRWRRAFGSLCSETLLSRILYIRASCPAGMQARRQELKSLNPGRLRGRRSRLRAGRRGDFHTLRGQAGTGDLENGAQGRLIGEFQPAISSQYPAHFRALAGGQVAVKIRRGQKQVAQVLF